MLLSGTTAIVREGEDSMLLRLLMVIVGEAVFGRITARHRGFQAEMERCLEQGAFVSRRHPAPPRSR